jgi:hypothetical protein
MYPH